MAAASTHTTQTGFEHCGSKATADPFVLPQLLRCLIISWSDQRGQLLQSVAEDESWQAKVCGDVQEFLRSVFQLDVPLTIVDLPPRGAASYAALREMAMRTSSLNRSLLVVCGAAPQRDGADWDGQRWQEELWVRQLGVWAYVPGATDLSSMRMVYAEARKALAKQSAACVEASGCR